MIEFYKSKGLFYWKSNDCLVPLDAAREYGIPVDVVAQEAALREQNDRFVAEYRERMRNHVYSAEELFEMRAAFDPGETVVNILTGRKIQL